jgi:HD superfamily phosphohydrolase
MSQGPEPKTDATRLLAEALDPLDVLPGHAFRMTRASAAVLHTRPLQRLARLRQVGLGHLVWPNAENTRLSHSIGTEYWVARFLHALATNRYAAAAYAPAAPGYNVRRLRAMDEALGPSLSLAVAARLFALVHDFALLPLGHTLHYQLGFFGGDGAEARRAAACLARVRDEVARTPEIVLLPADRRDAVLEALLDHLDLVECAFCAGQLLDDRRAPAMPERVSAETFARWLPVLTFVYDLTHALFSADLIDFALRDSAAAGMPRTLDERLLEHVAIFRMPADGQVAAALHDAGASAPAVYRFGLNAADAHVHPHVITAATSLYRIRYEIAERVFYHPAKCAADAMLDIAVRRVDAVRGDVRAARGPFAEAALLRSGDDALLDTLEVLDVAALGAAADGNGAAVARPVMPELLGRRLYREVLRIDRRSATPAVLRLAARALDADVRNDVDARIVAAVPTLAAGDVVFSSRPLAMQRKPPAILVGWSAGAARTIADIAESEGYGAEALEIDRRYGDLWSLSVYLRADRWAAADDVRAAFDGILAAAPAAAAPVDARAGLATPGIVA